MKITNKEAAVILRELKAGKHIQGIDRRGRGVGNIYYDGKYICWNHYGSSANEANLHGVKFIMEVIFKDCDTWDTCQYSPYHIGYIPDNPRYTGIDYSTNHPNVYGL